MKRGIVYVAWGERHIREACASSESARQLGYRTCLLTDDLADWSAHFTMRRFVDFSSVPDFGDPMFRKWVCLLDTPFDVTCFLDADTTVHESIDLGFDLAERYGIAATFSPGGIFHYKGREHRHYNGGCLYFCGTLLDLQTSIYDVARETIPYGLLGDEPPLSMSFERLGINPAVLPEMFNVVRAGRVHTRPIKVLHSRWSRATHLVSDDCGEDVAKEQPCPA